MSLRLTRRANSPFWWITGTIGERRIRESTRTDKIEIAETKCRAREHELEREAIHGAPAPVIGFDAAALAYLEDQPRSAPTAKRVGRLVQYFGPGKPCTAIDQAALDLAARTLLRRSHSPATKLREVVAPARAILLFAWWRGWCPSPQLRVKVPSRSRTEWLTPAQADAMEHHAPSYLRPLIVFLIGTGARMNEAVRLEWKDVDLRHARARLRDTKNKGDRNVDLPPRTVAALASIDGRHGRVFRKADGSPYRDTREQDGGGQIREPWARVCARAGLPGEWAKVRRLDRANMSKRFRPVHTPHSARHTWASWHYAEHRDVLKLKRDGGWQSVALVERYTHLVPAGMLPAIVAWRQELASIGTLATQEPEKVA